MDKLLNRKTCNDFINDPKKNCIWAREKPAWICNDTLCVHPLMGKEGTVIPLSTQHIFRKLGCAYYKSIEEQHGKRTRN